MKDKNFSQNIFVFVFIGVLVLLLIIAFILRYTIFKTGKYLVTAPQSELNSRGYGTYSTVFDTGCLTSSGKCDTAGVKFSTQYCVPHPETGYGCLDENGEMTFQSQTITENCLPNCRKYTLNNISSEPKYSISTLCQYSSTYSGNDVFCVPTSAKTFNYSIYTCGNNDAVGENACNYVCGSGGVTDAGTPGDSDPTLPSYVPSCVNKKGTIISLNSFPWSLRGALPIKGVNISKGYTIYNYPAGSSIGTASQNFFIVDPPYIPVPTTDNPNPSPTGTISTEILTELDNTLVVYENCQISNPKPYCGKRVLYKPTTIQSELTNYKSYFPSTTPPNIQVTAACYVDPYWTSAPPAGQNNALNPYDAGPSGDIGSYSMLKGISQYGYTYEYQSCIDNNTVPTFNSSTGGISTYIIPDPYSPEIVCSALTPITSATGTANNCYSDRIYIPNTLSYNNYANICNTVFPDGSIPNNASPSGPIQYPGTVVNCQYLPNNNQLNFQVKPSTDPTVILDPDLQQYIGNYIQIYNENTSFGKQYFLSLLTSPCAVGVDPTQQIPLSNCSLVSPITNQGYADAQPCSFIYAGGDNNSLDAGAYWGKNNCDGEMVNLTNALNVIISPVEDASNTSTSIKCSLFAYFGRVYGQLYPIPEGGNFRLVFKPLLSTQFRDKSSYNTSYYFVMKKVLSTIGFEVFGYPGSQILAYQNDGKTSPFSFSLDLSILDVKILPFNGPIIKSEPGSVYYGDNISTTLNLQRGNPCYYNKCDPSSKDVNDNPCFPYTCNLFYDYNPEIC